MLCELPWSEDFPLAYRLLNSAGSANEINNQNEMTEPELPKHFCYTRRVGKD